MKLIFPPKEISSVLPECAILSVPARDFSEATLADVHSLFFIPDIRCLHFSTEPDVWAGGAQQ